MCKLTIHGPFSIAMLNYQRVNIRSTHGGYEPTYSWRTPHKKWLRVDGEISMIKCRIFFRWHPEPLDAFDFQLQPASATVGSQPRNRVEGRPLDTHGNHPALRALLREKRGKRSLTSRQSRIPIDNCQSFILLKGENPMCQLLNVIVDQRKKTTLLQFNRLLSSMILFYLLKMQVYLLKMLIFHCYHKMVNG